MTGEEDRKDQDESRKIAIALVVLVFLLLGAFLFLIPATSDLVAAHISPGIGLKDSAIVSFLITVVMMVVFAIAAGDGLLGEIQYMLGAFFLFFIILWLMVAWIF